LSQKAVVAMTRTAGTTNTMEQANTSGVEPAFPIPASLQDLERAPYNLLPYPNDFADDDEATRADSFQALVFGLQQGNVALRSQGMNVFFNTDEQWLSEDRLQALYTLVRCVQQALAMRCFSLFAILIVSSTCTAFVSHAFALLSRQKICILVSGNQKGRRGSLG